MAVDPRKTLPTKINLIKLRKENKIIKKIRSVLEEKRNALILYVRTLITEYEDVYNEATQTLEKAYESYSKALLIMGYDQAKNLSELRKPTINSVLKERTVFAVKLPVIRLVEKKEQPPPGEIEAPPVYLDATEELKTAFEEYMKIVELETSIRKLIIELKNTQRLMNSIDHVILPSYKKTIKHIKIILEERIREDFMRLKVIKRKMG